MRQSDGAEVAGAFSLDVARPRRAFVFEVVSVAVGDPGRR